MMLLRRTLAVAAVLVVAFFSGHAYSADGEASSGETVPNVLTPVIQSVPNFVEANGDEWRFDVTPYAWVPSSVKGSSTIAGSKARLALNLDDVLELLEKAGSVRAEAWKSGWGVIVDATYVDLGAEADVIQMGQAGGSIGSLTGTIRGSATIDIDVDIRDASVDVALGRRLFDIHLGSGPRDESPRLSAELHAGGRYHYLKQEIKVSGTFTAGMQVGPAGTTVTRAGSTKLGGSEDWVEPIIGGRVKLVLNKRLAFIARGDVGGFGVGTASNLTWSVMAGGGFSFNDHVQLRAGYRFYDIDYSRHSGSNKFAYDAQMHGPWLGLGISW